MSFTHILKCSANHKMNTDTVNNSIGINPVVARNIIFRAFIFILSSVDGVTEAQLAGLAENVIRVDVAD